MASSTPNFWFCEFECYQVMSLNMYVKEIAILSHDAKDCYNYHICYPYSVATNVQDKNTEEFQYRRHRLPWGLGDFTFNDAINDIKKKVGFNDDIFVKGLEKSLFIKQYLSNIKCMDEHPSIHKLNNCLNEVCDIPHSFYCARRKVHELHYMYNNL